MKKDDWLNLMKDLWHTLNKFIRCFICSGTYWNANLAFAKKDMWVIPFEMGHSHPGDHLQIAWKFNGWFVNIFLGTVQIFSKISQVLFELWLFEQVHFSRF